MLTTPQKGGGGAVAVAKSDTYKQVRKKKPKQMLVRFEGSLAKGVVAKDLILWLIGQLGASAGTGYAVEYRGDVVSAMGMEARMTLCNMSIEWGARIGIIAPDDTTFSYLEHKACSPKGAMWERALAYWQGLKSDEHAGFDHHEVLDLAALGTAKLSSGEAMVRPRFSSS
ncbi:MAG: hypothetical protein EBX53_10280 [Betaproteobacteria bacterium]|nr:hypothetical protein [Betaproteobacteria bacterium]